MFNPILPILIFVLGASVGSFLSVAIYRIRKQQQGIIFGHSFCPVCKKKLRVQDLIPIVSYVLLRGKCNKCGKQISPLYLYLEVATGLVFLALYFRYPFLDFLGMEDLSRSISLFVPFLFYVIYASFFIAIFFYDLQTKKIPDLFLFPLLGIALLGSLIMGDPPFMSIIIALLITLIFFGGQILLSKGKWLGEGDLYLAFSLAIIFGWKLFLVNIVVTYFLGAATSIFLLATKQVKKKDAIAFAPFLILGAFITLFFGSDLVNWYLGTILI